MYQVCEICRQQQSEWNSPTCFDCKQRQAEIDKLERFQMRIESAEDNSEAIEALSDAVTALLEAEKERIKEKERH